MKSRIKRKIRKRSWLYNVAQVFKAYKWLSSIQRGEYQWSRYPTFGTIVKEKLILIEMK